MKIWITRTEASGLISRGLGNVFVWFVEPCLEIKERGKDAFALDNSLRKRLEGVLYGHNVIHNWRYYDGQLKRNHDQIDLDPFLVKLYQNGQVTFRHKGFGDGIKTDYQPTKVPILFGYDSEISEKIWKIICNEEFKDVDQIYWSDKDKPWWEFCKELEIEIKLI